jgi:hypothetical protein
VFDRVPCNAKCPDAELIYPVGPHGTGDAISDLIQWLEDAGGKGYAFEAQTHDVQGIAPEYKGLRVLEGDNPLKTRLVQYLEMALMRQSRFD